MSTGDLKNNLTKLQKVLRRIDYSDDVDYESRPLAEQISEKNIELAGKTDLRFVESMYKVLREIFNYKPAITKDQFFSNGFHERKVIMCTDILELVCQYHRSKMPRQAKGAPNSSTLSVSSQATTKLGPRPNSAPPNLPPSLKAKPSGSTQNAGKHRPAVKTGIRRAVASTNHSRPPRPPLVVSALLEPQRTTQKPESNPPIADEHLASDDIGTATGVNDPQLETASSVAVVSMNPGVYESGQYETEDPLTNGTNECHLRPIDIVAMTPGPAPRPMSDRGLQQEVRSLQNVVRELNARVVELEAEVAETKAAQKHQQEQLHQTDASSVQPAASTAVQHETMLARLLLLENRMAILESKNGVTQPSGMSNLSLPRTPAVNGHSNLTASKLSMNELNIAIHPTPAAVAPPVNDSASMEVPSIPSPIRQVKKTTHVAFQSDSPSVYHNGDLPKTSSDNDHASTPIELNGEGGDLEQQFFAGSTQAQRIKEMLRTTEDLLNIQVESPVRPAKANHSA